MLRKSGAIDMTQHEDKILDIIRFFVYQSKRTNLIKLNRPRRCPLRDNFKKFLNFESKLVTATRTSTDDEMHIHEVA